MDDEAQVWLGAVIAVGAALFIFSVFAGFGFAQSMGAGVRSKEVQIAQAQACTKVAVTQREQCLHPTTTPLDVEQSYISHCDQDTQTWPDEQKCLITVMQQFSELNNDKGSGQNG